MVLEKKVTRESFQILFSSPATGNEVYQIIYHNNGDNSLNFTRPNLAKKLNRKEAFVNAVLNLYGNPDDSEKWINVSIRQEHEMILFQVENPFEEKM